MPISRASDGVCMGCTRRFAIWGTALVVSLVIVGAFWRPMETALRCYSDWATGREAESTVVSVERVLVLAFEDGESCTAPAGSSALEDFEPGDRVRAIRRADRPGVCELVSTVESARALLTAMAAVIASLLLGVFLVASVVSRSVSQRPALTTRFDGLGSPFPCPRCGKPMEEGYLPLLAGVHWRHQDDPVGLPHALGGLPGTVGLRRRPKLHAFRCEPCQAVIFRYGA